MKAVLRKLAQRIDDMTLRERALMFGAGVFILVAIPYSFIITPSLAKQKAVLERIIRDQSQIAAMQVEMQKLASAQNDPTDAAARERLASLEQRLMEIGKAADAVKNQLVPPNRISDVLQGVLASSGQIQLMSLRTSPGSPLIKPQAEGAAESSGAPAGGAGSISPQEVALYRHGVELTVSGSYAELLQYLIALEKLPWRLLWEKIDLQVQAYPKVVMSVTLYTLSAEQITLAF
jgi:MSHA biogenesis protein MshJ